MKALNALLLTLLCSVLVACQGGAISMKKGDAARQYGEWYTASYYYRDAYRRFTSRETEQKALAAYRQGECYAKINYAQKGMSSFANAARYYEKSMKIVSEGGQQGIRERQKAKEKARKDSKKEARKAAKAKKKSKKKGAAEEEILEEVIADEGPEVDTERYAELDSMLNQSRFKLAKEQLKCGKYKEAKTTLEGLNLSLLDDAQRELALNYMLSSELGVDWKASPTQYQVKKDATLNARRSDYSPAIIPSGDKLEQLVFTSTRNQASGDDVSGVSGVKFADLFVVRKDEQGKWKDVESIEGVDTEYEEGSPCFSPDGRTMYFTKCTSDPDYPRNAEIWMSTRSDASWGKPVKCEISRDTLSNFAHPAVSADGQWLYFVSDMPGGVGGYDIWRTRIMSSGFGGAENLGRPINTAGDEMFPTIRPNGDLYFSSDGHPGMGGLDIFCAQLDTASQRWQVQNMGYPLNSSSDDFGMTFDGVHNRGYFSSSRNDGKGWDHLYWFEYPEILQTVTGWVYEKDGYELPNALVHIVGNDGTKEDVSVRGDGSFSYVLKPGVRYVLLGTCTGYLNVKNEISVRSSKQSEDYTLQFPLPPMNLPVLIENIFYEFDKATLTENSREALDKLVGMMEQNPHITIELASHCDYRGNDDYNKRLSQRRAQSVVDYMIAHGVAKDRLTAKGYGETRPKIVRKRLATQYEFLHEGDTLTEAFVKQLKDDEQDICNALNRRTEFSVLRTTYGMTADELRPVTTPETNEPEGAAEEDEDDWDFSPKQDDSGDEPLDEWTTDRDWNAETDETDDDEWTTTGDWNTTETPAESEDDSEEDFETPTNTADWNSDTSDDEEEEDFNLEPAAPTADEPTEEPAAETDDEAPEDDGEVF